MAIVDSEESDYRVVFDDFYDAGRILFHVFLSLPSDCVSEHVSYLMFVLRILLCSMLIFLVFLAFFLISAKASAPTQHLN